MPPFLLPHYTRNQGMGVRFDPVSSSHAFGYVRVISHARFQYTITSTRNSVSQGHSQPSFRCHTDFYTLHTDFENQYLCESPPSQPYAIILVTRYCHVYSSLICMIWVPKYILSAQIRDNIDRVLDLGIEVHDFLTIVFEGV